MARILLVDDYDQLAMVLKTFLVHEHHEVTIAENGRDALEQFDPQRFDLVITDLWMPEMGGVELIEKLKAQTPAIKILAISGAKGGNALQRLDHASAAGADATLAKPFGRQAVIEIIDRLIPPKTKPKPPSASRPPLAVEGGETPG